MLLLRIIRSLRIAAVPPLLLGILSGCSGLASLNAVLLDQDYPIVSGIAYGSHARQKLDIHMPTGPKDGAARPVILFFYGGAWKNGDRDDYRFVGEALVRRGYIVVVPDYRLYPEVRFPAFVEDGAKAAAWVRGNIAAKGGDPDRIYLAGHSAGAHLAALLAYDRRYLEADTVPQAAIAGLIGLAGPYAFDPAAYRSTRPVFASAGQIEDTQPIRFVTSEAPPALLLHGEADGTVLPVNARELAETLEENGVPVRLVTYPETGHIALLLAFYPALAGNIDLPAEIGRMIGGHESAQARP